MRRRDTYSNHHMYFSSRGIRKVIRGRWARLGDGWFMGRGWGDAQACMQRERHRLASAGCVSAGPLGAS